MRYLVVLVNVGDDHIEIDYSGDRRMLSMKNQIYRNEKPENHFKRTTCGNDDDNFNYSNNPQFHTKSNLSFVEIYRFGRDKGSYYDLFKCVCLPCVSVQNVNISSLQIIDVRKL